MKCISLLPSAENEIPSIFYRILVCPKGIVVFATIFSILKGNYPEIQLNSFVKFILLGFITKKENILLLSSTPFYVA